jgi:hypothetical protein
MQCDSKDEIQQHLSHVRLLAARFESEKACEIRESRRVFSHCERYATRCAKLSQPAVSPRGERKMTDTERGTIDRAG